MQVGRLISFFSLVIYIFFSGIEVSSTTKESEPIFLKSYNLLTKSYSPIVKRFLDHEELKIYNKSLELQKMVSEESCYIGISKDYGFDVILDNSIKDCVFVFYRQEFSSDSWKKYLSKMGKRFFVDSEINLVVISDEEGFSKKLLALQLLSKMETLRSLICLSQVTDGCVRNPDTAGMFKVINYLNFYEDDFESEYSYQIHLVIKSYDKIFASDNIPQLDNQILLKSMYELNSILGPSKSSKEYYLRLRFVYQHALYFSASKNGFIFSKGYEWVF